MNWYYPPHKGQWHGALMFSLICTWTNGWVNDLRCHHAHYDVTVMNDIKTLSALLALYDWWQVDSLHRGASNSELWCFLGCYITSYWTNNLAAGDLRCRDARRTWLNYIMCIGCRWYIWIHFLEKIYYYLCFYADVVYKKYYGCGFAQMLLKLFLFC